MPVEPVEVAHQLVSRAFAGPQPEASPIAVQCDEIDFRVTPIPPSADGFCEREIADLLPAPLLVKGGDEAFQSVTFGLEEPGVGLPDEELEGSEVGGRHGHCQGREPGAQEVVPHVEPPATGGGAGQDGLQTLDHPVAFIEDLQVAAHLDDAAGLHGLDIRQDVGVRAAGMRRDVLQHEVVPTTELLQEPIVRFRTEWRAAREEHLAQDVPPGTTDDPLFVAVTVELRHSFEQVPQEQQSLRLVVRMHRQQFDDGRDVQVPEVDGIGDPVVERGVPIVEERGHLGEERPEDDEATRHLVRLGGEPVHLRLQLGCELVERLSVEVLELVEGDDPPGLAQRPDARRE
jgi:hypothetical protein